LLSMNYRLGRLGFFSHPAPGAGHSCLMFKRRLLGLPPVDKP
jgi:hypothetical protein